MPSVIENLLMLTAGVLIGLAVAPPLARWLAGVPPEPPRYRPVPRPVAGLYAWDESERRVRVVRVPEMDEEIRQQHDGGSRGGRDGD